jgi:hypothetical protein
MPTLLLPILRTLGGGSAQQTLYACKVFVAVRSNHLGGKVDQLNPQAHHFHHARLAGQPTPKLAIPARAHFRWVPKLLKRR